MPSVNGWGCILVAATTIPGDFNSSTYATTCRAAFGLTWWHDLMFVRFTRTFTAALLVVVAVVLIARVARARGLARQSEAAIAVVGSLCVTGAALDQFVWAIGTPAALALPEALVRTCRSRPVAGGSTGGPPAPARRGRRPSAVR